MEFNGTAFAFFDIVVYDKYRFKSELILSIFGQNK